MTSRDFITAACWTGEWKPSRAWSVPDSSSWLGSSIPVEGPALGAAWCSACEWHPYPTILGWLPVTLDWLCHLCIYRRRSKCVYNSDCESCQWAHRSEHHRLAPWRLKTGLKVPRWLPKLRYFTTGLATCKTCSPLTMSLMLQFTTFEECDPQHLQVLGQILA